MAVALVTGAARGIGAACVLGLAQDGFDVVALDRCGDDPRLPYALGTEAELHAVAAAAGPGRVLALPGDAGRLADVEAAVRLAEEELGGLDVVVAAAGVIAGGVPHWETAPEQEQAVLDGNLGAALTTARATIPALLRRPQPRAGRFVAIASAAGTRGLPMLAAYCAAKAGIVGLVRALALELRGTGVTAVSVSPGSTATPILDESARLYGLDAAASFAAQQPVERLLDPAEIAAMVRWLAGPGGAAVTGADLHVDGGLTL
jgi:SDR family mycofactocin-dependent oxidoreductase